MDLDQIAKRLEWLDSERRKDKATISSLEERIAVMEGNLPGLSTQIKEIDSELTHLLATMGRLDQIEASVAQVKVDLGRSIEAMEKQRVEKERDYEKLRRSDFETLTMSISEVRRGLDPIPDLKKGIQTRVEEDFRLARLVGELEQKIDETRRGNEDFRRTQRVLEEAQKQDIKRLTDIQGELATLRKRSDEMRGKIEVSTEMVRKYDQRINELLSAEAERRQTQVTFLEKITLWQVERDRSWKEIQSNFESITKQAVNLDSQLQTLDATHRQIKRSQEGFEEITNRFERRINEITEMQRLETERFRQEWTSFKADDQKRWMNNTLEQEEQKREVVRTIDKNENRLVALEDITQEVHDLVHQINEESLKRLQSLLALSHEMLEDYDRVFGRA